MIASNGVMINELFRPLNSAILQRFSLITSPLLVITQKLLLQHNTVLIWYRLLAVLNAVAVLMD